MKIPEGIPGLWLYVVVVPIVCIVGGDIFIDVLRGRSLSVHWSPFVFVVASPFFLHALIASVWSLWKKTFLHGRRAHVAAMTGTFVSMLFWSLPVFDATLRHGGGANIGLGLILLASPLVVAICMVAAYLSWPDPSSQSEE